MPFRVEIYHDDGSNHSYETFEAPTEAEVRKYAARALGRETLRGASVWDRYQGGTVYQFGAQVPEHNGHDFAVIYDEDEVAELAAEEAEDEEEQEAEDEEELEVLCHACGAASACWREDDETEDGAVLFDARDGKAVAYRGQGSGLACADCGVGDDA